jgi:predicted NUDIX family phosphoesterase
VLVVPASEIDRLGTFDGFRADGRYFASLAEARFVERGPAEEDPSFRQIIPYVVFRAPSGVFSYGRTPRGTERRLHGLRSIGVGGHVNPEDLPDGLAALATAPEAMLAAAARRELAEEVVGAEQLDLRWLGFLCESQGGVAQVHFGVVFAADVSDESVRLTDEGKMAEARYASIAELLQDRERYEGWSRYVIGHLAGA